MSLPTFYDELTRLSIAHILGDRFGLLEAYLTQNRLKLYRSPSLSPQGENEGNATDWDAIEEHIRSLPSLDLDALGTDNQLLFGELPTGTTQDPSTIDTNQGPYFPGTLHGQELVLRPLPTGIGQTNEFILPPPPMGAPGDNHTEVPDLGGAWNLPNMEPVFPTREANEAYFRDRMAFFVDSWGAEASEAELSTHVFSFHDWVLRLPNEPMRLEYEQVYRDAAREVGLRPQLNGVIARTPENYGILSNVLMILENRARTRALTGTTATAVPRFPPPPTNPMPPPPTTTTRPPRSRRRKRSVYEDSSNDEEDDEDNDDEPSIGRSSIGRPPPKKRGRKVDPNGTPEELAAREKKRIHKQRWRAGKKRKEEEEKKREMKEREARTREARRIIRERPVGTTAEPLPAGPEGSITYDIPDVEATTTVPDQAPGIRGWNPLLQNLPFNASLEDTPNLPLPVLPPPPSPTTTTRRTLRPRGNRNVGT